MTKKKIEAPLKIKTDFETALKTLVKKGGEKKEKQPKNKNSK